ncbi:DUF4383 domain-containing protein [Agromyces sp. NPDC058484]|uniref:DUF4383 domain-containing protein n=1 Tax=Agromyces sp. NPDC058484 TaxID=3346524 RepID=UPI00365C672A
MHATAHQAGTTRYAGTPVQKVAAVFGVVFLFFGIAGFIPGLTTDVDTILFFGHESGALLLGLFQVSILHNIVHLLFGVAGLWLATSFAGSRAYLIWGGVIYAVLLLYGLFVAGAEHAGNFVPINVADNWLHAGLAVAMILLGVLLGRRERTEATA